MKVGRHLVRVYPAMIIQTMNLTTMNVCGLMVGMMRNDPIQNVVEEEMKDFPCSKDGKELFNIQTEVVFQDRIFTIAKAVTKLANGRVIVGEGLARRSYLDRYTSEMGKIISTGRAVKALKKKLDGKKIHSLFMG